MTALDLRTRYGADYDFFMAKGNGGFIPVPDVLKRYLHFLIITDQETHRNPETRKIEIIRQWQRPIMSQEILMLKLMIEARYSLSETIPPASHIAASMQLCERQARRWRANLIRSGLIETTQQKGKPSLVSLAPLIARVRKICGELREDAQPAQLELVAEVPDDTFQDAEQSAIGLALASVALQFKETLHNPEQATFRMGRAMEDAKWKEEELLFHMQQACYSIGTRKEVGRRWSVFFREMDTRVKQAQIKAAEEREWERFYQMQDAMRAAYDDGQYAQAHTLGEEVQELHAKLTRRPVAAGGG